MSIPTLPEATDRPSPEDEFDRLYSELNVARADYFGPRPSGEEDGALNASGARYELAERTFMTMPAPLERCIWMKWEVLEIAATKERTIGPYFDNRVIRMIAQIKADHLRFCDEREV